MWRCNYLTLLLGVHFLGERKDESPKWESAEPSKVEFTQRSTPLLPPCPAGCFGEGNGLGRHLAS